VRVEYFARLLWDIRKRGQLSKTGLDHVVRPVCMNSTAVCTQRCMGASMLHGRTHVYTIVYSSPTFSFRFMHVEPGRIGVEYEVLC
jgi:hypothetical protein